LLNNSTNSSAIWNELYGDWLMRAFSG